MLNFVSNYLYLLCKAWKQTIQSYLIICNSCLIIIPATHLKLCMFEVTIHFYKYHDKYFLCEINLVILLCVCNALIFCDTKWFFFLLDWYRGYLVRYKGAEVRSRSPFLWDCSEEVRKEMGFWNFCPDSPDLSGQVFPLLPFIMSKMISIHPGQCW